VVFAGFREDVNDILAACDFYLYCGSPQDGMPTCVLEAAASGLPVVGFKGDVGAELIPSCGGLLIDHPGQLSQDVVAALADQSGCGVSYAVSNHGRDRWLSLYEDVFREVAA
jgi:glycosyltransferase involved in cell wall biosynthesis